MLVSAPTTVNSRMTHERPRRIINPTNVGAVSKLLLMHPLFFHTGRLFHLMLLEPVLDYNISSADSNTSISNDDQKYWSKKGSKEYHALLIIIEETTDVIKRCLETAHIA